MSSDIQQDVLRVTWDWRVEAVASVAVNRPTPVKVIVEAAIPAAIGLGIMFGLKHRTVGIVVLCIAAFILLSGLFAPRAHAAFKNLFQMFAKGVGVALTWLLLVPFFYIFFTFGRLSQFLRHKDPMNRAFPTDARTYWIPHAGQPTPESYKRQY